MAKGPEKHVAENPGIDRAAKNTGGFALLYNILD
jgi:hypothetical protein